MERIGVTMALVSVLLGCAPSDPEPSARFDGHYVGTVGPRRSESCARPLGAASATVTGGHVLMYVIDPDSVALRGTVGQDGRVNASGAATGLVGGIVDHLLEGELSDPDCHSTVRLTKDHPINHPSVLRPRHKAFIPPPPPPL